jgi:hypothetical protein
MRLALIFGMLLLGIVDVDASRGPLAEVEVLVNGVPIHRYNHNGTTYIEAIKGKEYELRVTNPIGVRVAVALSVDGLNTIDAHHTDARSARKWVLEPYQSIILSGWQTNAQQARRFFFTTEERSYGARLNRTENLGIISAVFFREKIHPVLYSMPRPPYKLEDPADADAAGAAQPRAQENEAKAGLAASRPEYAATGIGDRIRHEVQSVYMELEDQPFSTVNLRYEFRPVLVRLGVIQPPITNDPIARRERAHGFREGGFCPEP